MAEEPAAVAANTHRRDRKPETKLALHHPLDLCTKPSFEYRGSALPTLSDVVAGAAAAGAKARHLLLPLLLENAARPTGEGETWNASNPGVAKTAAPSHGFQQYCG